MHLSLAKQKQLNFKKVQIYLGIVKSNQYSGYAKKSKECN